ncbi:hypothetical protein BH23GEM2_BH23GEM2_23210 [soil metagenome]
MGDRRRVPIAFSAALALGACAPAIRLPPPPPPPVVATFVAQLGTDTVQIEWFERTATSITGRTVTRSPRTVIRDFSYRYRAEGTIERMEFLSRAADLSSDSVLARTVVTFANDTAYVETGVGESARTQWIPARAPDVAWSGVPLYSMYEFAAQRTPETVGDSVVLAVYFSPALGGVQPFVVKRVTPDSVTLWDRNLGTMRAMLDPVGRVLAFDGTGSSLNYIVTRADSVMIDSIAVMFAARDGTGGLGPISPRDTVRATVHGANFTVEYGRPSVRGREIFGAVVPWGRVWRTGANQATHFTTDRDVVVGGLMVPHGSYTLWTLPSETGWELIINRQTGQWGTLYDPAHDLGRVPLEVRRVADPVEQLTFRIEPRTVGGMLIIAWDTYEASVPFSPR